MNNPKNSHKKERKKEQSKNYHKKKGMKEKINFRWKVNRNLRKTND